MSKATITFYNARNVSRDDLFSEELHAVNNAGQRFRSADKFRRIPVMAGRHEIGTLIEVRDCGFRYYIAVAADMSGFEFALQFAAPCDATKALAGHLHGFKHACFGGGALRSVKSAVVAHCAQAETVEATEEPAQAEEAAQAETVEVEAEEAAQADDTEIVYSVDFLGFDLDGREFRVSEYGTARAAHAAAKEFARSRADYGDQVRFEAFHGNGNSKIQTIYFNGFASGYIEKTVELTEEAGTARLLALIFDEEEQAQAETAEAEEPAKVEAEVEFGPFEYEGDGAHSSELTRAGECVGEIVKECDTDDRRVDCYRVRSWLGEIDRAFNVSAHGTARAALKAARQFAQTL
jgi:hypothetical protein